MILQPADAELGLGVTLVTNINHQALQFRARWASNRAYERASSAVWRVRTTAAVQRVLIRVVHDRGYEQRECWGASCKALAAGQTTTDMYILQSADDGLSEVAINEPIEAGAECRLQLVRFAGPTAEVRLVELFMIQDSVTATKQDRLILLLDQFKAGLISPDKMRELIKEETKPTKPTSADLTPRERKQLYAELNAMDACGPGAAVVEGEITERLIAERNAVEPSRRRFARPEEI